MPLRAPETAHHAVAAFAERRAVPAIGPAAALLDQRVEPRGTIFEHDALGQAAQRLRARLAQDPHQVFAFHSEGGMHQPVGQSAVGGQNQQSAGVQVEAADRYPAPALEPRQCGEYGRMPGAAVARDELALRFVVCDDPVRPEIASRQLQYPPVQAKLLAAVNLESRLCPAPVDAEPPCRDPGLHFAAGGHAGRRQVLLDPNQSGTGLASTESGPASKRPAPCSPAPSAASGDPLPGGAAAGASSGDANSPAEGRSSRRLSPK